MIGQIKPLVRAGGWLGAFFLGALAGLGCGGEETGTARSMPIAVQPSAGPMAGQGATGGPAFSGPAVNSPPAVPAPNVNNPPAVPDPNGQPAGDPNIPPVSDPAAQPPAIDPVGDPAVNNPGPVTPGAPAGPEDGDPSKPIVSVPGVNCGPNPSLFGLTSTNVEIGGRGVHVAYPCNKHEGAPVTIILNLHGTMDNEDLKLYQVAYFSANTLVDSHNFITLAPKSVVSQWTNGDGGKDMPHLMEVIEWAYANFAKFDIRGMWVAGHSWGAMFTGRFACDPSIQDKVVGAFLMSGSGMNITCANRISVLSSAAEMDIGPVINQGQVPASHGCGASQESMIGNNVETYWPDCDPGFTHANYFMLGKGHIDYIDADVVKRIGDLINQARR